MSELDTQILETWRIHNRTMLLTISSVPEEAFRATLSKRGGRDIARQLAHACNVRISRLTAFGKRKGIRLAEFDPAASPSKKVLHLARSAPSRTSPADDETARLQDPGCVEVGGVGVE